MLSIGVVRVRPLCWRRGFAGLAALMWETICPDPMLSRFAMDYRWLTDVYESVRPSDITGRLVWHALGAKTIDLINEHVIVELPDAGTETTILDAQTIEDLMSGKRRDIDPKDRETDHRTDRPSPDKSGLR